MKKTLIVLAAFFLFYGAWSAFAAPVGKIQSDPATLEGGGDISAVDIVFQAELDGVIDETIVPVASKRVEYPLKNLSVGAHTMRFRFGSVITSDNGTSYNWSEGGAQDDGWSDPFALNIPASPHIVMNLELVLPGP